MSANHTEPDYEEGVVGMMVDAAVPLGEPHANPVHLYAASSNALHARRRGATPTGSPVVAAVRYGTGFLISSAISPKRGPRVWLRAFVLIALCYVVASVCLAFSAMPKPCVWSPAFGYFHGLQVSCGVLRKQSQRLILHICTISRYIA